MLKSPLLCITYCSQLYFSLSSVLSFPFVTSLLLRCRAKLGLPTILGSIANDDDKYQINLPFQFLFDKLQGS